MHAILCHLEQILPSQLANFVLFDSPVQVSLINLITTSIGVHPASTFMLSGWVCCTSSTCATRAQIPYFFFDHRRIKSWDLFQIRFVISRHCLKRPLLLDDLGKMRLELWGLHVCLLCLHLLTEVFVYLYADSFLVVNTSWLFLCDRVIFACDYGLESSLLYADSMDDDLEDFGKLFFTNIVLVEAKFLYGSKDL